MLKPYLALQVNMAQYPYQTPSWIQQQDLVPQDLSHLHLLPLHKAKARLLVTTF
eukprot:m.56055 g.56055  ORF g.56055 m.56055 type:complete len:54 (-) comp11536_c1_seq1:1111-1272(-)